jgi:ABC-type Fe3+/spermidine/putrescine transport system ATPase subunit
VVFDQGRIEQVGAPEEIYHAPASPFAARFVGDANVVAVQVLERGPQGSDVQIGEARVTVRRGDSEPGPAWLVLRPEALRLSRVDGTTNGGLTGRVADLAFRGTAYAYRVDVPGLVEALKIEAQGDDAPLAVGDAVAISWGPDAARLLAREEE